MITIRRILASLVVGTALLLAGQGNAQTGKRVVVLGGFPNLVTNGNFALNPVSASQLTLLGGWQWANNAGTGTVVWNGSNTVTVTGDGTHVTVIGTGALATVAGHTYVATVDVAGNVAHLSIGTVALGSSVLSVNTSIGKGQQFQFVASTTSFLSLSRASTGGAVIANVSVRRKN